MIEVDLRFGPGFTPPGLLLGQPTGVDASLYRWILAESACIRLTDKKTLQKLTEPLTIHALGVQGRSSTGVRGRGLRIAEPAAKTARCAGEDAMESSP